MFLKFPVAFWKVESLKSKPIKKTFPQPPNCSPSSLSALYACTLSLCLHLPSLTPCLEKKVFSELYNVHIDLPMTKIFSKLVPTPCSEEISQMLHTYSDESFFFQKNKIATITYNMKVCLKFSAFIVCVLPNLAKYTYG
jgi:hypothetical protein